MPVDDLCRSGALRRIKGRMSRADAGALLLTGEHDIRYMTGFYVAGAMLLVRKNGRPEFFVDPMNAALASASIPPDDAVVVTARAGIAAAAAESIRKTKAAAVIFDPEGITVGGYRRLAGKLPRGRLKDSVGRFSVRGVMGDLRAVKSASEIRILREAARETVRIWRSVKNGIKTGMSEREIAGLVDAAILSRGYVNSFPTIAATGENTAYPHAIASSRRLGRNEHVLVDFGIRYKGYCSDLTRTCYNGRINGQILGFRKFVREARDAALKMIAPGVAVSAPTARVNKVFKDNGLGDCILHSLGHGVGLEVHEKPFVREHAGGRFRPGMVITVEPGLYRQGMGGVREEDMVLVTERGCEVLTV